MRKFLLLLIALLAGVSGAWAAEYTVTYSAATGSYTATNPAGTWASAWKSTAENPFVTLTAGANNIAVSTGYIYSGASGCTYTLTAQNGYLITGYTIVGTAQEGAQTLTPAAGGSATTFATAGTTTLTVTGLSTVSTSFTQSTPNKGIAISSFTITVEDDPEAQSWIPSFGIGSTIVVTGEKTESVTAATNGADNDHWYLITQVRNGESALYDNGTKLMRGTTDKTAVSFNDATVEGNSAYLVRFISAGSEDLYHLQLGNGRYIVNLDANPNNGTAVNTTSDYWSKGTHAFYNSNGGSGSYFGWNLNSKTAKKVDNNGAGNALSYWGEGTASGTSGNSIWYVYPVTINTPAKIVDVTYNLVAGGDIVNTKTVTVAANSEIIIPSELTAGYATSYYNFNTSGTIGEENCTITVTAVLKDASVVYPYTNVSNAKSYYIYTNNQARGGLSTYTVGETTYLASSVKSGLSLSPKKFAIINYEENYYLYSVDDEMFVTFDGAVNTNAALAATVTGTGDRITFTQTNAPLYEVMFDGSSSKIFNSTNSSSYPYGIVFNNWGATSSQWDDGCQYTINEADDFDPADALAALDAYFHPATSVQYVISDANGVVYTSESLPATEGETISTLPAAYQLDYCNYTVTPKEIAAGENTVNVTVTYNLPFTEGTWYYATLRGKQLRADDSAKDGYGRYRTNSINEYTDVYKWAFFGNPYTNIYIKNKGQDGKYLYADDVPTMTTLADPTADNKALWAVTPNDTDGFTLRSITGDILYINDAGNAGNLGYWNSASGKTDGGSKWVITEVSTAEAAIFNSAIATLEAQNWGTAIGLYSFTGTYAEYAGKEASVISDLKEEGYTEENFATVLDMLDNIALNTPTAGFYRLKNVATDKYLVATALSNYLTTDKYVFANGTATDAATIIQLRDGADGIYMYNQGYGFGWVVADKSVGAGVGYVTASADKYVNWFPGNAAGQIGFAICLGNGTGEYASYLMKGIYTSDTSDESVIGGTDYTINAAQWVVEEATTATVTLNSDGAGTYYATFCAPFSYTVDGAMAYTLAEGKSGDYLVPTEVEGAVPAGMPVLLKGSSSSATLTISGSDYVATPLTTTALTGTYLAKTIVGDTDYVLGTDGTKVGFYHWDTNNLAANRAYVASVAGVKGFVINWGDAVGIKSVDNGQALDNASIFNLAGQRLNKVQRGVNIVNGKKVIVK